jgi:hypothetical protein
MVKRCFTCQARTEQKCGRCGRKCCDEHLYHATAGPIPEVCGQCADEENMSKPNALGVFLLCIGASLFPLFILYHYYDKGHWDFLRFRMRFDTPTTEDVPLDAPATDRVPLDEFVLVCMVGVLLMWIYYEVGINRPSSKAQRAGVDRFWQRFTALRAWLGAAGGPGTSTRPAPGPARRSSSADGSGCHDPPGASGPAEHSQSGTAEAR